MQQRLTRKASEPLGHRVDGTAFWAYFGSAGTDDDGNDGDGQGGDGGGGEDDDPDDSEEDDDRIGDDGLTGKGRRAIQAERATAQKARERLKPVNALYRKYGVKDAAGLEALLEKGKSTSKKDEDGNDGPSADEIREQARREASEAANTRLIRAGVKAVAAELLNDPKDALAFLDLSDYEVDENGDIDEAQVKRDLKALLADKSYLGKAKKGDGRNGGAPNFDGGTRKTSQKSGMNDFIRRGAGVIR